MYNAISSSDLRLIYPLLLLQRRAVGVKFLFSEEEFDKTNARPLTGKLNYCVMVKSASGGYSIKARLENFGCSSGAKSLGLTEDAEYNRSGRFYRDKGMYRDLATCKNVSNNMTACGHKAYGILLRPVEMFDLPEEEPDIALFAVSPYQAMRLVQGYTYHYGTCDTFKMTGNKAFCSECTAYPFESNHINVSMLCAGTRFKAQWQDCDMAVGMPFRQLPFAIDGVLNTVNSMEPDDKKEKIQKEMAEAGYNCLQITFGHNYYTGLFEV